MKAIKNTLMWQRLKFIKDEYFDLLPLRAFACICQFFPLQRKVVFDNFNGRGFGDDPKYIALALIALNRNVEIIWLTNKLDIVLPPSIKPVRYNSFSSVYHLVTARIWVDNVKNSFRPHKRKGQFYIQTWHAILGLKKVEEEASTIPYNYRRKSIKDSELTDLMYSNNNFYYYKYSNTFWYKGKVIKCGIPKDSIIIKPTISVKNRVYSFFRLPFDTKLVLYAPTFRKGNQLDPVLFDYHKIIAALSEKFGGKFVMLLRLHPNYEALADQFSYDDTVISATSYPDMQELLSAADIMINDYSSSMFEFSLTEKPVFLFCKDYQEYRSGDRGMEFSIEELPYPVSFSQSDLLRQIEEFDFDVYKEQIRLFYHSIGLKDDGLGDRYISDLIVNYLDKNE